MTESEQQDSDKEVLEDVKLLFAMCFATQPFIRRLRRLLIAEELPLKKKIARLQDTMVEIIKCDRGIVG